MNISGVVVEYNPFHNGHAHHLQETKKQTNADLIIAVMSGSFLQRGEPALVSKWARTKMALAGGADIIVELPYAFATQKAQTFAAGAVSILDHLGVNHLCFGSEDGTIESFTDAVALQATHRAQLDAIIQQRMQTGSSYPSALSAAHIAIIDKKALDLTKPNNILGFHYTEAIRKQKSAMQPHTISRLHAQYHDEEFASNSIASATSIRKQMQSHDIETAKHVMPEQTYHILQQYHHTYGQFHTWEQYFSFLKYKVLTMTANELRHTYEAEEGLENRLVAAIQQATSFEELMHKLKTKRYTWTRLQRLCLHVLTATKKEEMYQAGERAPYIRLLGMSKKGQRYISTIKKQLSVPLLTHSKTDHPLLEIDKRATQVYYSILPEPLRSHMLKQDVVHHPIRYDEERHLFE